MGEREKEPGGSHGKFSHSEGGRRGKAQIGESRIVKRKQAQVWKGRS